MTDITKDNYDKMTDTEGRLYYALAISPGKDIPITTLWDILYYREGKRKPKTRNMQQSVGSWISRINKKAGRKCIVPGNTKRTYAYVEA